LELESPSLRNKNHRPVFFAPVELAKPWRGQHSSTIIQCLKKKQRWCTKFEEQDIWVSGCGAAVIAKKRDWKRVLECKAKTYDPIILQLGD
jgi:hypothetical protein